MLRPREIVAPVGFADVAGARRGAAARRRASPTVDGWTFELEAARRTLLEQLQTHSLDGFGLERPPGRDLRGRRAGAVPARHAEGGPRARPRDRASAPAPTLVIDPTTLRNLEVVEAADGGRTGSLLHEIDRTVTPMGGRLLRAWLLRPLLALERIHDRLDAVEEFAFRSTERAKVRETLKRVHDIERLVARAALGTAGPRDLVALRQSLAAVPRVRCCSSALQAPLVRSLAAELDDLADVRDELESHAARRAAGAGARRRRRSRRRRPELDELRDISRSGKQRIAEMEEAERARTGITSLKIRFNRVFGYYIEISKSNLRAACRPTTTASRPLPAASASSRRR